MDSTDYDDPQGPTADLNSTTAMRYLRDINQIMESRLDPRGAWVFCEFCRKGNHPQWMCNYRKYHGKQPLTCYERKRMNIPFVHHKAACPLEKKNKQGTFKFQGMGPIKFQSIRNFGFSLKFQKKNIYIYIYIYVVESKLGPKIAFFESKLGPSFLFFPFVYLLLSAGRIRFSIN